MLVGLSKQCNGRLTCRSFMSVDEETKSNRLLIFFSLAFRVTAVFVYDSISLHMMEMCVSAALVKALHNERPACKGITVTCKPPAFCLCSPI